MFPRPTPKRPYCRKHSIEYTGYLCPECREELSKIGKDKSNTKSHKPKEKDTSKNRQDVDKLLDDINAHLKTKKTKLPSPEAKKPSREGLGNLHDREKYNSHISLEETSRRAEEAARNLAATSKAAKKVAKETKRRETEERLTSWREEEERKRAEKETRYRTPPPRSGKEKLPPRFPKWFFALLLIFSLSLIGLGLGAYTGSLVPMWLLLGFSGIYSTEKWFRKVTLNKAIGKFYKLMLNLGILSTLGLLVWSGIQLVSKQFTHTPLIGSLVFLAEFIFFVWISIHCPQL